MTAVAVVVHGSVAHVVLVHQVYDLHYRFLIVGGVSVDLHIEDMSAGRQFVVGSLDLCLMSWRAGVIYRNMAGFGVVVLVSDSWNYAESLAVFLVNLPASPSGGGCQHGIVVPVCPGELVGAVADVTHYLESEGLRLLAFSMVFPGEGYETLGRTDEADSESPLVDHFLDGVVWIKTIGAVPERRHHEGNCFGESGFLEIETLFELQGGYVEHFIEVSRRTGGCALRDLLTGITSMARRTMLTVVKERFPRPHRCLFAESVLEDASAASHRSHFVHVSPGVVGTPFGALIESRVEIEKVREESACRDLAGEPVQVVVAVFRQIAYAAFLFHIWMGKMAVAPLPTPS